MRAHLPRKHPVELDSSRNIDLTGASGLRHGSILFAFRNYGRAVSSLSARTPISPSCLDPRVPIHTTLQETVSRGSSSGMTSTACPRLSLLKFPRSLNPFGELSTIRQGNLSVRHRIVATTLARLVLTTRSERRLSGAREVRTAFAPVSISQGFPPYCLRI